MQRFILEITMVEDEYKIFTFTGKEYEFKLYKCRGEEEYSLKASDIVGYWEYIVNATCLGNDDEISVLLLTDQEECKDFLTLVVAAIKDSNVKRVSNRKNIWKLNEVKHFILKSSKLINFTLKGIDEGNKVIFSDNQVAKKLYFDSLDDLGFDKKISSDSLLSKKNPKDRTPNRPVGPFKPSTPKRPKEPQQLQEEPKSSTGALPSCTGDDVVLCFQERTKEYCETTVYKTDE